MENINYGIDLGTTNSGIARFVEGKIQIIKNPVGLKDTIPSVVAYKNERILIGEKARELLNNKKANVYAGFKRYMGTDYEFQHNSTTLSATDLSATLLSELKNYTQVDGLDAVVITIPAAFNTMQSNATKKAGEMAGFEQVVLLQEPIAACLAYANANQLDIESQKKWLVYDLGGGTFDCALVKIDNRELKVVDHKGNNYLGGIDLDQAILKDFVLPKIQEQVKLDLTSKEYQTLKHALLYQIEEVKKTLSIQNEAWFEIEDDDLNISLDFKITRADLQRFVTPIYEETEQLMLDLLQENNLSFNEIERIILVGGTTYIPQIRASLKANTQCLIDTSMDPTTAIIQGAAYFAGTKPKTTEQDEEVPFEKIEVNLAYEPTSQDEEELIALKTLSSFKGYLRITRTNGGYDSGLTKFKNEDQVLVPLIPRERNLFNISLLDKKQRTCFSKDIEITQGLYLISDQTLPADICLELDDNGQTYLEAIFTKNSALPIQKTVYKTFSKTVEPGSDDAIIINILEGSNASLPASNLCIGRISISGKDLNTHVIKGTDIEIQFLISESRDLNVEVHIPSIDLTLTETFEPDKNIVDPQQIKLDLEKATAKINHEIAFFNKKEDYESSLALQKLLSEVSHLKKLGEGLELNWHQADEKKRSLFKVLDSKIKSRHIQKELNEYQQQKTTVLAKLEEATQEQKEQVQQCLSQEKQILNSGNARAIQSHAKKLKSISLAIFYSKAENFVLLFMRLKNYTPDKFKDYSTIPSIIEDGNKALEHNNYLVVKNCVYLMSQELKSDKSSSAEDFLGGITGIK